MARRAARQLDGHGAEGAFLRLRERSDPLGDTLETRAVPRRQAREPTSQRGPVQEQRSAGDDIAETLSILAQRRFAARPHRFYDWRGNREGLGRHAGSATAHELGNRATPQHAGVFLTIGRRLTAR
ncbi:MAG: hypothetical protein AUH41_06210 [Gemmatimonadetes bacterium 13_1_40CM_66_11]|nr:MAG: hypothetical protein AUH41_06210 [Gemmatimonadetes bacterium 13_1_40CM_66_11]